MDLNAETIIAIISIVATMLGGKEAWSYYKRRLEVKAKITLKGNAGETELREEIQEMLENQVAELKAQIKELTKRMGEMEKEREEDKKRIARQDKQIAILTERLGKYTIKARGKKKGGNEGTVN